LLPTNCDVGEIDLLGLGNFHLAAASSVDDAAQLHAMHMHVKHILHAMRKSFGGYLLGDDDPGGVDGFQPVFRRSVAQDANQVHNLAFLERIDL
jgi:hypothetical protein